MSSGSFDPRSSIPGPAADAHILVVDDGAQIHQLAAKLLRDHGHRVSIARDGREMWQVLDCAVSEPSAVTMGAGNRRCGHDEPDQSQNNEKVGAP